MFGWLFGGGKRRRRKRDPGWNHTNAFNFMKPPKAPKRKTALRACQAKVKRLEAIIKQKNNEIRQLKKINQAQKPMADSGVNAGTYRLYQQHFRQIIAITMKRQRLSTYTMPEIRGVCDAALGLAKPTEFKGYGRGRGK